MRNLALYIKAFLDRYIYFVPIIMLLAGLYTSFVEYSGNVYNYTVVGNTIGWSIFSSIVFFYFFNFKGNYCWFTRNAPIGLILINIADILGFYFNYKIYSVLFNIVVCGIIITLALIFKIKNSFHND